MQAFTPCEIKMTIICCVLCISAVVVAVPGQSPLVITRGGTYSGSWISDEAQVPVVQVETSEPVIFDHCTFKGGGILVQSRIDHSDIVLRNCTGIGENPNLMGRCAGRFVDDESFDRIRVEHCKMDHTAGIYLRNCIAKSNPTIAIIANRTTNIDGRKSDGHGGYLSFNLRTNRQTDQTEAGFEEVQFLQLDGVHAIPGVEIAWNYVTNEPGDSRVEDNINLYNSSGTANSPIKLHDNCIRGAYPIDPTALNKINGMFSEDVSYSGGGMMLGDGAAKKESNRSAYVRAVNNVVIGTTNYAIAIAAGHDIRFDENVMISAGTLSDGRPVMAQNVGAYIWNVYKPNRVIPSTFTGNGGRDNVIGWTKAKGRNDSWTPDAAFWTGNIAITGPITRELEDAAEKTWQARADKNGIQVGLETTSH